jgi:hypothetical protein
LRSHVLQKGSSGEVVPASSPVLPHLLAGLGVLGSSGHSLTHRTGSTQFSQRALNSSGSVAHDPRRHGGTLRVTRETWAG